MSQTGAGDLPEAPVTGQPDVDAALAGLDDLGERPLDEHHDRLSAAHEKLHDALQDPGGTGADGGPDTTEPRGSV